MNLTIIDNATKEGQKLTIKNQHYIYRVDHEFMDDSKVELSKN